MLTNTHARLKHFADQKSRLEDERAELGVVIKETYDTAKSEGFTVAALRKAIKIHAMDQKQRDKHDAEQTDLEVYLAQLEGRSPDA